MNRKFAQFKSCLERLASIIDRGLYSADDVDFLLGENATYVTNCLNVSLEDTSVISDIMEFFRLNFRFIIHFLQDLSTPINPKITALVSVIFNPSCRFYETYGLPPAVNSSNNLINTNPNSNTSSVSPASPSSTPGDNANDEDSDPATVGSEGSGLIFEHSDGKFATSVPDPRRANRPNSSIKTTTGLVITYSNASANKTNQAAKPVSKYLADNLNTFGELGLSQSVTPPH